MDENNEDANSIHFVINLNVYIYFATVINHLLLMFMSEYFLLSPF